MKKILIILLALVISSNCYANVNSEIKNIDDLLKSKAVKNQVLTEQQLKQYVDKKIINIKEIYDSNDYFLCSLANSFAYEYDTDNDGLSDAYEIFKYKTNPNSNDTDKDGILDGEQHERQEHVYNYTTVIKFLNQYDLADMNNDYQDVKILEKNNDHTIFEITIYPYTKINLYNFKNGKTYNMIDNTKPTLLCNYDKNMKKDILSKLKLENNTSEKTYISKILNFAATNIENKLSVDNIPHYLKIEDNSVRLLNTEALMKKRNRKFNGITDEQILTTNVLGKEMFYNKTAGNCFSNAIYNTTILRSLNVPTRICHSLPLLAYYEDDERKLLNNISDKYIKNEIEKTLSSVNEGVLEHKYWQVYIGNKWLNCDINHINVNFSQLGFVTLNVTDTMEELCNILNEQQYYFLFENEKYGFEKPYHYQLLDLYEYKKEA